MTSDKPTRQQIADALRRYRRNQILAPFMFEAEAIADVLVKDGLAVEPREPGWYWVRGKLTDEWDLGRYLEEDGWLLPEHIEGAEPAHIHPSGRILPPQE